MTTLDSILTMVRDGTLDVDQGMDLLNSLTAKSGEGETLNRGGTDRSESESPGAGRPADQSGNAEPDRGTSTNGDSDDPIQRQLLKLAAAVLERDSVNPETSFFELGMDSFKILQFFYRVQSEMNVQVDPTCIADHPSVARFSEYIAMRLAGENGLPQNHRSRPAQPTMEPDANRPPRGTGSPVEPGRVSAAPTPTPTSTPNVSCRAVKATTTMDFGLYFFANYDRSAGRQKYRLLLDAVRFADARGFSSVFVPERHFQEFGGNFPNPSVLCAALAPITSQIHLRAGSVVSPLHDPIRIAEEWSVVDNLCGGRAGVSFTYGWQCDDFVFYPDRYLERHAEMFRQIETVRKLWRGEPVRRTNGMGRDIDVRIFPEPIQAEVPVWVTCAISRESFVNAGKVGANIVTFLLGQGLGDLREKIALYRQSLADHGFDPSRGRVSLMVHTYLGRTMEEVRTVIREPFLNFIRSQAQLARNLVKSVAPDQDIDDPKSIDALMEIGFERFSGNSGLLGTLESCREAVPRFAEMGVDELSCLIDFGLDYADVMNGLEFLDTLRAEFKPSPKPRADTPATGSSSDSASSRVSRSTATATPSGTADSHASGSSADAKPDPAATPANGGDPRPDLMERLTRFRSYLPGGSCVPGQTDHAARPGNGAANPAATSTGYPAIQPDPSAGHDPFPLTPVQKGYFLGRDPRFELGSTSTHGYVELSVSLDLDRFADAVQRVIDRHPMLRAVVDSGRAQRVLKGRQNYRMPIVDLRELDADTQRLRVLEERGRQSHRVFDPGTWPLFDFRAFRLADNRQYLMFGFDSLIADAASLTMIFRELMQFYREPDLRLPELELTFRDYVLGAEAFRESAAYQNDRAYWLKRLESIPEAPTLPLTMALRDVGVPRFRRLSRTLSRERWAALKSLAARNHVTPTAFLFTGFARALFQFGNSDSFTLNLTVFNRHPFHRDVGRIVGDFTSLMLVPCDLAGNPRFWENARRVQGAVFESLNHRHFDGVEVIRELARSRDRLGDAIMPIVFTSNLLNTQDGSDGLNEIGTIEHMITQTTQAYLDHQVSENRGELLIAWDYVEELFEPAVIEGLFSRFIDQLETAETDPTLQSEPAPASTGSTDSTVETSAPGARETPPTNGANPRHGRGPEAGDTDVNRQPDSFVERYNATRDDSIIETTLPALFQEQARRTPNADAIRLGNDVMSYAEVDARSNQVAALLASRGVRRGDRIGLMAPRAFSTIINALGILKAGAAYVPVDPDYPPARREYILKNSDCREVLDAATWERHARNLSPDAPSADRAPGSGDLAYVIYTSGSTGKPKGVMIRHGAVTNTILDINQRLAVRADDRIMGISSMCFDLSVYDVFGSFAAGACLVLVEDIRDPEILVRTAVDGGVTIWNSVPTLFGMWVDQLDPNGPPPAVRAAMLSGDWIPVGLPAQTWKKLPDLRLISLGGATEASIWSIWFPLNRVDPAWTSIPYGRPLANQEFYVLDPNGDPCELDAKGELFIGGRGLAAGYMNDPEKTARSFIQHPRLGPLYRTGDWGVWRREGHIEFLGRVDHQVKIRGFRVELGEIENRLAKHPRVRQAAVIDRLDAHGERGLKAFITTHTTATATATATPTPTPTPTANANGPVTAPTHAAESVPGARTAQSPANGNDTPTRMNGCGLDERLLHDPAAYDAFKKRQLTRFDPAPANAVRLPDTMHRLPACVRDRRSAVRFDETPVSVDQLSLMLAPLRWTRDGSAVRSCCASTGGLYGVDLMLSVKPERVSGLPGGAYSYCPADHTLRPVAGAPGVNVEHHVHRNRRLHKESAVTLGFVFDPAVTRPVYGEAADSLALIEAGVILATLSLAAETAGLALCPIGMVDFPAAETAWGLSGGRKLIHVAETGPRINGTGASDPNSQPAAASTFNPAPTTAPTDEQTRRAGAPSTLDAAALRSFLSETLPDYMIPAEFVVLDRLPLTANDKVDREGLRQLNLPCLPTGTAFAAAREPREVELTAIWSRILKKEPDQIGVNDNFFDLGGDSIDVADVRRELKTEFGLDVGIVHLFQHPTIRKLATFLAHNPGAPDRSTPADAETSGRSVKPLGGPHTGPGDCAGAGANFGADAESPAETARSAEDRQALEWARQHPDDPRARSIVEHLQRRKTVNPDSHGL